MSNVECGMGCAEVLDGTEALGPLRTLRTLRTLGADVEC